jgi:hypothetical protein
LLIQQALKQTFVENYDRINDFASDDDDGDQQMEESPRPHGLFVSADGRVDDASTVNSARTLQPWRFAIKAILVDQRRRGEKPLLQRGFPNSRTKLNAAVCDASCCCVVVVPSLRLNEKCQPIGKGCT